MTEYVFIVGGGMVSSKSIKKTRGVYSTIKLWDVIPNMEKLPHEETDKVVWTASSNGIFSLSLAQPLGRDVGDTISWCDVVWCYRFIPNHRFMV